MEAIREDKYHITVLDVLMHILFCLAAVVTKSAALVWEVVRLLLRLRAEVHL